jgi:hypothetical protein
MGGTASPAHHGGVRAFGDSVALLGALLAVSLGGCGGNSAATGPTAAMTSTASGAPTGEAAPEELQGIWELVSKKNPEKGLRLVISESHYRVVQRLAHGDLVVNGNEIAFFNAAVCGLQLPDGVGHYRWTIEGERLHFDMVEEDPCGGRSTILEDATYKRIS